MISIIIPFYNEENNLELLYESIVDVCKKASLSYELLFVNDGSLDKSAEVVRALAKKDRHIVLIQHRMRMWKGAGLVSGIQKATGEIIIFMDADLQDDPESIPNFVKKIEEGYDFVNGWRKDRKDNALIKNLPSKIGNKLLIKGLFKSKLHDINCGYKAMKKDIFREIVLYGDNFRFLPLLAEKKGFKVTELVVTHHKRHAGVSKYGFFRRFTAFADILTSYFLYRFAERPLHFFGFIGGALFGVGFLYALFLLIERIFFNMLLYRRPGLIFAVLLMIVGIQIIMTGIIAELIVYLNKRSNK